MIQLRYMYHRFQSFKKSRPFHIFFVYKAYQGIHMENALHRGMNVIIICIEYGPLYLCQNLVLQPRGSVIILLLNSELLLLNHEIKIFRKALLPLHEKEFPRLEVIFYSRHLIGLGKIRGKGSNTYSPGFLISFPVKLLRCQVPQLKPFW